MELYKRAFEKLMPQRQCVCVCDSIDGFLFLLLLLSPSPLEAQKRIDLAAPEWMIVPVI